MSKFYFDMTNTIIISFDSNIKYINNMIELVNITDEAMRNYHYLWYSHKQNRNYTILCMIMYTM